MGRAARLANLPLPRRPRYAKIPTARRSIAHFTRAVANQLREKTVVRKFVAGHMATSCGGTPIVSMRCPDTTRRKPPSQATLPRCDWRDQRAWRVPHTHGLCVRAVQKMVARTSPGGARPPLSPPRMRWIPVCAGMTVMRAWPIHVVFVCAA